MIRERYLSKLSYRRLVLRSFSEAGRPVSSSSLDSRLSPSRSQESNKLLPIFASAERGRGNDGFGSVWLLLLFIFFSSHAMADDNSHCKIYGNCIDSPKAAEKGADLVIEDMSRDAKGNPVTPADVDGGNSREIGRNVNVQIKQPSSKYVNNEKQKKQLEGSEVNIGTVSVDAKTGETELQTPPEPNPDKCDYSYMVGKKLSEITMPKNARVLHEGDAVTLEYTEGRVNIILDKNDVIVNVTCG